MGLSRLQRVVRRLRRRVGRLVGVEPSVAERRRHPRDEWAIGVYGGPGPARMSPLPGVRNPVLTARDVTDVAADFVADPFMLRREGSWSMFFEVLNRDRRTGEIGLATSPDALSWTYRGIVLSEPFHVSYPHVFADGDTVYMIPETSGDETLRLYRARRFPDDWELVAVLARGVFVDPSVFRWKDRWWLLAETNPIKRRWDTLRLYQAEDPRGPWREHPSSPVVNAVPNAARPAGRVVVSDGRPIRFAQVCQPHYGTAVRAFEIHRLDERAYRERELQTDPVLGPAPTGWNRTGMHHIDLHRMEDGGWVACVDGCRKRAYRPSEGHRSASSSPPSQAWPPASDLVRR